MIHRGKGPLASRLRQRKFQLLRRFSIPADALPGSLSLSHLRCGKPTCHCADDRGHPVWSLTFMVQGKKRVQHIPKQWVEGCGAASSRGGSFKMPSAKYWRPTHNCSCWSANIARRSTTRKNELFDTTSRKAIVESPFHVSR